MFLQNQNMLPLPFCWNEQDEGNLQVLLCGQELDRLPGAGSLEPGQLCCLVPGGLGNLGFSQRTLSSGEPLLGNEVR